MVASLWYGLWYAGTKVYAVKGGTVDNVWYDYGGGNSIQIKQDQASGIGICIYLNNLYV